MDPARHRGAYLLVAIIRIEDRIIRILEQHADADALLDGNLVGMLHLPHIPVTPELLLVTAAFPSIDILSPMCNSLAFFKIRPTALESGQVERRALRDPQVP